MIQPWDDCKVAFGINCADDEQVWTAFMSKQHRLPTGWSLFETDASGSRLVVVFRVEDVCPRVEDGRVVLAILRDIEQRAALRGEEI